ncbi:MAG TPA: PocR ligand-binding domain-containing protein, partial [Pyrinomonadaceae bacterium]|nr:PocR ligand-binding domain-containing protein [Pyrinomonadaceae bacterium]
MEKIAAAERAKFQSEELQTLAVWEKLQASVASESDLAILLVEGHQPPQLAISNNNSICQAFQSSTAHAHLCDPYCGEAFKRAHEAGEATHYRCHAGLHCFAMPLDLNTPRPLAVIGGRAFLSSADYRELVERFRTGDLRELLSSDLFRNVIFSLPQDLDELAARLAEAGSIINVRGVAKTTGVPDRQSAASDVESPSVEKRANVAYFPPGMKLQEACQSALERVAGQFKLKSVAVLLRTEESFAPVCVT